MKQVSIVNIRPVAKADAFPEPRAREGMTRHARPTRIANRSIAVIRAMDDDAVSRRVVAMRRCVSKVKCARPWRVRVRDVFQRTSFAEVEVSVNRVPRIRSALRTCAQRMAIFATVRVHVPRTKNVRADFIAGVTDAFEVRASELAAHASAMEIVKMGSFARRAGTYTGAQVSAAMRMTARPIFHA